MFAAIEAWLIGLAQHVPLEWFVFIGAFIEEVVAPIPSPIVMTMAGSITRAQELGIINLVVLAVIGAVGKTIGSYIIYLIADKAEDLLIVRFGKFVGVTHKEIESIGKYFNGSKRDLILMTLARAIPIMPTSPVSIMAGVIKMKLPTYLIGTALGTLIRNMFYLYVGFVTVNGLDSLIHGLDSMEKVVQVVLAGLALVVVAFVYYKRGKDNDILATIKKWFKIS